MKCVFCLYYNLRSKKNFSPTTERQIFRKKNVEKSYIPKPSILKRGVLTVSTQFNPYPANVENMVSCL